MPAISMFYGIIVYMYYMDNKKHSLPHIYAKYGEHRVVISIPEEDVLSGSFPRSQMRLLLAWTELRRDELMADWDLALNGQQPYEIKPL